MSIESGAFQSGLKALKQKQYPEAIKCLEHFCQICQVDSQTSFKEYIQAQMGLVKAYHKVGKVRKARLLCQRLSVNKKSRVKAWAKNYLAILSEANNNSKQLISVPEYEEQQSLNQINDIEVNYMNTNESSLTDSGAAELLNSGNKALADKSFAKAVEIFERYCQQVSKDSNNYTGAQTWLIKAYKGNGELEKAIALCQELTKSDHYSTKTWAQQYLFNVLNVQTEDATASSFESEATITLNKPSAKAPQYLLRRTPEEFKIFCQNVLLGDLEKVESTRKQVLGSIIFFNTFILIVFAFVISFCSTQFNFIQAQLSNFPFLVKIIFFLLLMACVGLCVTFYIFIVETYANDLKSKIIEKIFDFINDNKTLNYSRYSSDIDTEYTKNALINSQLFNNLLEPNKITQNECISGIVGNTDIFFSDIAAYVEIQHPRLKQVSGTQEMRKLDKSVIISATFSLLKLIKSIPYIIRRIIQGRKIDYKIFEQEVFTNQITRKSIFKGLFFQARFNKNFPTKIFVVPHFINANIHSSKMNLDKQVKLQDQEFVDFFTVYGDDQVDTRNILSTNLMTKLVKFRKRAKKNLYISFVDNMIYIAIEYPEDIFEPRLYQSMLSLAPMREFFENIQLMLSIVEELNLNRRIWGDLVS